MTEIDADSAIPRSLDAWVKALGERGMPIFARTARDIAGVASRDQSSAAELARVILQDAAMTARLLRVANSSYYNPGKNSISTVSRAVVVLGFEVVRSICLSIAVVENLLKGAQRERILMEMARSFHAAAQARAFAIKHKDPAPEEVFIATLLLNLGQMAFWSVSGEQGEQLSQAMKTPGITPEQAEEKVLGFKLQQLTLGLAREWNLGELLQDTLEGKHKENPRISNILVGHELAHNLEQGWESRDVKDMMQRLAEKLYMPLNAVHTLVQNNARDAARTAASYGVANLAKLIPVPRSIADETLATARADEALAAEPDFPSPDPVLQLKILRELTGLLEAKPDINLLLEMVLEGIYRGVGMDRTLFALLSPDRRQLRARYALGQNREQLVQRFSFQTTITTENLFSCVVMAQKSFNVSVPPSVDIAPMVTSAVRELTSNAPFYVSPIVVNGQSIGLFYADRQPSARPLDDESYASFNHFVMQANMTLALIMRRGK